MLIQVQTFYIFPFFAQSRLELEETFIYLPLLFSFSGKDFKYEFLWLQDNILERS